LTNQDLLMLGNPYNAWQTRHWPSTLQHVALVQLDQALHSVNASALLAGSLEAQGLHEGHIPTRLVWAALQSISDIDVQTLPIQGLALWLANAPVGAQAIAINRLGECACIHPVPDSPHLCRLTARGLDGQLQFDQTGPLLELAAQHQLVSTVWVIKKMQCTSASQTPWSHNYVTEPFWQLRREAVLIVGSGILVTLLGVATPLGFQAFMDKVLPFEAKSSLLVVLVMLSLAIFASSVVEAAHNYLESVMSARLQNRLGKDMLRRLLRMPVAYFDSKPAGELTKLATQIQEVANFQVRQLLSSVVAFLSLLVVLPLLLIYSTSLTLMVLGIGCTMALTVVLALRVYQRRVARAYALDADFQSGLIESIKGVRTIKSLALERHFEHKQGSRLENQLFGLFDVERLNHLLNAVVGFQSKIVAVMILGVGAQEAFKGTFTVGQLIAFYMLSDRLIQPLMSLVLTVNGWQSFRLAKAKLSELMPPTERSQLPWGTVPTGPATPMANNPLPAPPVLDGDICFDQVHFRYPSSEADVLKGVSLTIPKGSMVGIVGESGSGKSTLISLLQGDYPPSSGTIRIGGVDIRDMPQEQLRQSMALVSQSSFLFNQSVFENVRLGRLNATANEVVQALEQARCSAFIDALPERYATVLTEDGLNLSGGQRQRLSIARAFLRQPPIMLFDEATSALDRATEEGIKEAVKAVCQGKTALLIAHRWSTLADCDTIVVMAQGQVVKQGRPTEILPELAQQTLEDKGAIQLC